MEYLYLLVLFVRTVEDPGFVPDVIEKPFPTALACYNTGFSMIKAE